MWRSLWLATAMLLALFVALAIHRCDGFVDDVSEATAAGEDWLAYRQNAVSIVEHGMTMPAVQGNYLRPGGFLYNYFVAAVFAVTRPNSSYVYVTQAALLAVSVGLMAAAFSSYLSVTMLWCFALALAATAYVDVFRYYTFKLLSENLLLLCLSGWWLSMTAAIRRPSAGLLFVISGVALGLCALTRPNLLPLGPVVVGVLWIRRTRDRLPPRNVLLFGAGFVVCASLLVWRNLAATGQIDLSVLTYTGDWMRPPSGGVGVLGFYGRRALFPVGFLSLLDPAYSVRPHWVLAWMGVAAFGIGALSRRLETWEVLAATFVAVYLGPLIAVAHLTNYGYRMIVPVVPAVLLLACRAVDLRLVRT
jgi:hypothetical protein